MDNTLKAIREANQTRAASQQLQKQHNDQMGANAAVQSAIFSSFQMMADMFKDGQTKMSDIFRVVEELEKSKLSTTEAEVIKAGLKTLEKQIKGVPVDDLKKLPKFLERPDTMKVSNLSDVEQYFSSLESAIKALKLNVEAPVVNVPKPVVNVPAPIVNVDAPDLNPIQKGLESVTKAVKANKNPDVVKTERTNTLITEKFDRFELIYDDFDSEEVEAVVYYLRDKQVARVEYTYENGRLVGGRKA